MRKFALLAMALSLPAAAQDDKAPAANPEFMIVEAAAPSIVDVPLPGDVRREPEGIVPRVLLNNGAGILNPDFKIWVRGLPMHWYVAEGREAHVSRELDSASDGSYMAVSKGGYNYNFVRQEIDIEGPVGGKTVVFSVDVKQGGSGNVKIVFLATYDRQRKFDSPDHPANGEWMRMEFRHTLPADFRAGTVDVGVVHYNDPKDPCYIRNPQLEIVP
jgi:hypothetical protein